MRFAGKASVISHLDHVVYPVSQGLFDEVIGQFTRAGFTAHTRQVRHDDGRVSAFFRLSGGYLEFCTGNAAGSVRGCSIWLSSTDLVAHLACLLPSQRAALALTAKAPAGETAPAWLIANLPAGDTGDVSVSLIEYVRGIGGDLATQVSDNGLFALGGVSLLCARPKQEQHHYFTHLDDRVSIAMEPGRLMIGQQRLAFLERQALPGNASTALKAVPCLVHLITVDVDRTKALLQAAGFKLQEVLGLGLLAQSSLVPAVCLVIDDGLSVQAHHDQLLARRG